MKIKTIKFPKSDTIEVIDQSTDLNDKAIKFPKSETTVDIEQSKFTDSKNIRRFQWRMLFVLMFCYLFYYTGRQNFGWAIPLMMADEGLGLSATQLGTISGAMLMCYAIGQSINGNLGDKFGGRIMVTIGGLLSFMLNWITSFSTSFYTILFPWATNGLAQSMGWAPGSRILTNWWGHSERGKAFGFYVGSAALSSVLIFALGIFVVTYLPWQWVFRLPVLLLAIASIVFFIVVRNKPEDMGFKMHEDEPVHDNPILADTKESSFKRYSHVLKNGRFLLACLSIGFENMTRYGLLVWVPLHYMGPGWKEDPSGLWVTLALPIGMACGALSTGFISDKLFKSNRSRPIAIFLFLAMIIMILIYLVPPHMKIVGMILLFLAGIFVYGPQSCYWALCPDLFGRHRSATAIGIMNFCAYLFAAVGEPVIGIVIDSTNSTSSVFAFLALASALGVLSILPVRR